MIQTRSLWRDEAERVLEGAGMGNVVYDEAGAICGYDRTSNPPVRHRMASLGHEPARGTHDGQQYGMTVRVKQEIGLAAVSAGTAGDETLRAAQQGSNGGGAGAGAVEGLRGVDDWNLAGGANFLTRVGRVIAVPTGLATLLATAPRREPSTPAKGTGGPGASEAKP